MHRDRATQTDMPIEAALTVSADVTGDARTFTVEDREHSATYQLAASGQRDYLDLFARVADDFGTRVPHNRKPRTLPAAMTPHRPLLTAPLSTDILYGYGDPAVLWVPEERAWYMVVTSNDAPDAFPICRSSDLIDWRQVGFVFPQGCKPEWAQDGANVSDFWAPELHRVGDEYLVCFSARESDRSLSIGIARASHPGGPFSTPPTPLLRGGVIDAHVFVEDDGQALLFWKEDSNGVWPRLLAAMFVDDPGPIDVLFTGEKDRRTAVLTAAMWRWAVDRPAMEQFFILQPLIEAAVDDFSGVRARLAVLGTLDAERVLAAMQTRIMAQRLDLFGSKLVGEAHVVLVNDLAWEAHLIEGPWVTRQLGRYYLFYAGNDFSTEDYGIGVAVADRPLGPYIKMDRPLIRSDAQWTGPGHPSVAPGPDDRPRLFYHAFCPGEAGYKAFRALLTVELEFQTDGVTIV